MVVPERCLNHRPVLLSCAAVALWVVSGSAHISYIRKNTHVKISNLNNSKWTMNDENNESDKTLC